MTIGEEARKLPVDESPGEDSGEWLKGQTILDRIVEDRAALRRWVDRVGMTPSGEWSSGLNVAELFSGDVITVLEAPREGQAPERSRTNRHGEFDLGTVADAASGAPDGDRLERWI